MGAELAAIFGIFLRFGCLAWGGPVAQIAMIRDELVDQRKWIAPDKFRRALAVYQALPGPEAHELCVYFGMARAGRAGGLLAGLAFMLPGLLLMLLASWAYTSFGASALLPLFVGVAPAVTAMIVRAAHRLSTHVLVGPSLWAVALGAAALTLLGAHFAPILCAGATWHALWSAKRPLAAALAVAAWSAVAVASAVYSAPANIAPTDLAAATRHDDPAGSLLGEGLKGGMLSFGGAYAAIPFLRDSMTDGYRQITEQVFLDGIGLGSVLPAPLIIFGTFLGYVAGGLSGALLMTLGIFLPAFAFTLIGGRYLERAIENQALHTTLDGVSAAVVGLLAVTALQVARGVITGWAPLALFAGSWGALVLLKKKKWGIPVVISASGLLGRVLLACALAMLLTTGGTRGGIALAGESSALDDRPAAAPFIDAGVERDPKADLEAGPDAGPQAGREEVAKSGPEAGRFDWPNWMGPRRDGISLESGWRSDWPATGLPILWNAEIGIGFSSCAVVGKALFTMGHVDGNETVYCFDAESGVQRWTHSYPCQLVDNLHEGGPGATPTVDGEFVYTVGREGQLYCFEAASGKVVWRRLLSEDLGLTLPEWGFTSSPCIVGDQLLLEAGRAVSYDKRSGDVRWKSELHQAGYGSACIFSRDGAPSAATLDCDGLRVVDVATGAEKAFAPWTSPFRTNSTTPIVVGDKIFISTAYNVGCALFRLTPSGLELLYKNRDMRNHFNNSVLYDGYLYGFDGNSNLGRVVQLTCMEFETGKVMWTQPGLGCGSLMIADGKLLILSEQGTLALAKASPQAYQELATSPFLDGRCWTVPVLCNGRIYGRNAAGTLACADVSVGSTSQ